MKALVKKHKEKGIWLEDVDSPELGPNDVLIKIEKTAICGTDIHIYQWDAWAEKTIPVPMHVGHEFFGHVVETGKAINDIAIDSRVSGEGHIVCGRCRNCRAGVRHLCGNTKGIGVDLPGAFAEYLVMPAVNVFPIPDDITADQAANFDPFGNAVHTALTYDLIGEDVLITGAGPIGSMAAAVACHVGARHVVITDVNDFRLELASKLNERIITVNPGKEDLKDVMSRLKMKEGFDVGLEMSGSVNAFNDMTETVKMGGQLALLGILPHDAQIRMDDVIFKSFTMKGIYGRRMFETWYKMTAMLQSGLNIDPIITHHFPVENYLEGFELMSSGNSGKIILNWN
jgi:threonine 3-dehydrogenase